MPGFWALAIFLAAGVPRNTTPTAAAIMARVAANQNRSNRLRADYIYRQRMHVVSRKANGKLMCEETRVYLVVPGPKSITKKLLKLTGRYRHKGRYINFTKKPEGHGESIDCNVVDSLAEGLISGKSKSDIAKDLFPLTTQQQKKDQFKLIDEETLEGRKVYRIRFRPKDRKHISWAGEADIDTKDFEPVDVFTKLSRRLPFAIRTFLVALPGVGFNVQYERQPDGVWFPATFGTEFRIRVLMFYRRVYAVSLENTDFRRTHVRSKIQYAGAAAAPEKRADSRKRR